MLNIQEILEDLPKSFEEFWLKLTVQLNFEAESEQALTMLKLEVEKLFSVALFEAVAEVLSEEEKMDIEQYLLLNPDENPLDHYFAMAAEKPEMNQVLEKVLTETAEQIVYLKSKIK